MRTKVFPILLLCVILVLLAACASQPAKVEVNPAHVSMFVPMLAIVESPDNPLTDDKIALGRMLYYETRLSKNHDVSCNSCHLLDKYGVDGEPVSEGHKKLKGNRNSPTVYNAAGHFVQFWDGRAAHVEEQAKGPIMNPVEMAMPAEKVVVATLKSMPEYVAAFQKAFPNDKDPVTFDNAAKAIAAFERKLITPGPWDKFLKGDAAALTDAQKAGFNKYMEVGCQACHMGTYLGASMYQKLGAVRPWTDTSDLGRYAVTKQESDKMMFKVPSLRNVEKTAPYYHNGSIKTLDEATKQMAYYQLGKDLAPADVASINAFLASLTGELPLDYIKKPELPASTPKTPKPVAD